MSQTTIRLAAARLSQESQQKSQQILDAAFEEFVAEGYARTRLEDIARRAGVAKGLPHFYFGSKGGLFSEVLRRVIVPIWSDLNEQVVTEEGSTGKLLRATLSTMYSRLTGDARAREMMRLLIAEGRRFPELTQLYYQEVVLRGVAIWDTLLKRGIAHGEFDDGPIHHYPQVLYGPALMAAIWQLLFGAEHPLDLTRWFEAHVDLVLRGLESRPKLPKRKGKQDRIRRGRRK